MISQAPNSANLASPNECRQCFNKDELQFEEDQRTADLICMRCGFVANRIVSEETDWRDFEEDAVSKSRVGAAHSIYGESKLETQVAGFNKGGDRLAARGGIARKHQQLSHENSNDIAYRQRIAQMADICELDESVKALAESLYLKVSTELRNIDGKKARLKTDGLCAAIIFIACKKSDAPRTFKELHRTLLTPERDMMNAYKHIDKNLPGLIKQTGMTAVESLLRRMCGQLRIPPQIEEIAVTVGINLRNYNEGRLPSTLAACALSIVKLYVPAPRDGALPSDTEIAETAGVAASTVQQIVRDMLVHRESLFPEKFRFDDAPTARQHSSTTTTTTTSTTTATTTSATARTASNSTATSTSTTSAAPPR